MTAFTVPLGTNTHTGAVVRVVLDESYPFLRVIVPADDRESIHPFLQGVDALFGAPSRPVGDAVFVNATTPDSLDETLRFYVQSIRDRKYTPVVLVIRSDEKLSASSEDSLDFIVRHGAANGIRIILVANYAVGSRSIGNRVEFRRDRDGRLVGQFGGDNVPSHFSFYPLGVFE